MRLFFLFVLFSTSIFAQPRLRKLPPVINHPSIAVSVPYISADGSSLLFTGNNGEAGALIVSYATRETDWKVPVEMPKFVNARLCFLPGYGLSGDGKQVWFTTMKSPTLGGYDIQYSELRGVTWSEPLNPGKPVNSSSHDGAPSIAPDGKTLYFMRCDQMDTQKASGCRILMIQKKSNGQWDEPVPLPETINTGNSQMPRILPDGETLYFSSDKMTPSKGGFDLYMTRMVNGTWTTPVALDFINTAENDLYVSVSAYGRFALVSQKGTRNSEIVEVPITANLRPKGLMRLDGSVTSAGTNYVSVLDLNKNQRIYQTKIGASGTFQVFLKEGSQYEVSIDPELANYNFASKRYNLTGPFPEKEKFSAAIQEVVSGTELQSELLDFIPGTAQLTPGNLPEIQRLSRIIKSTGGSFEVQVLLNGYFESTKPAEDLTETIIDSLSTTIERPDSAGNLIQYDSSFVVMRYHNDRTVAQANSILKALVNAGVSAQALSIYTNAIPSTDGRKKILIRFRRKS